MPPNSAPADVDIERLVRRQHVHLLYQQPYSAIIGNMALALFMCLGLWDKVGAAQLAAWMAVQLLVAGLPRWLLLRAYARAGEQQRAAPHWERWYGISMLVTASVWGLGAALLLPADSAPHQFTVMLFLMCMTLAVVWAASTDARLASMGLLLLLLPTALWMVLRFDASYTASILIFLMTLGSGPAAIRRYAHVVSSNLRLSIELEQARERADRLAMLDELTGLCNRRAFYLCAGQALHAAQRSAQSVGVVMLDIDHFKSVNDNHGHATGDEVLRQVGQLVAGQVRQSDVCGRLGGEEFCIFLPGIGLEDACALAAKLCAAIGALELRGAQGQSLRVTGSFGVAAGIADGQPLSAMMQRADSALYRAKQNGRNQVMEA